MIRNVKEKKLRYGSCLVFRFYLDVLLQLYENHGKLSLSPIVTLLSVSSMLCSLLPSCYSFES